MPLREQGTLLTAVRGCDLTPKFPLTSTERQLVGFLRWCFMVPADEREVGIVGGFYWNEPPREGWKPSELGHYPLHWVTHLMHAYEVVGYRHPEPWICHEAASVYFRIVKSLHLKPESMPEMFDRLSEDRIATGEVVS